MVPETDREELRWKQLLPLWPSAFIRRLKNRRHRVAQMPFIGRGSIAHRGLGRAPLICPVSRLPSPGSSRHPQRRGSSWAQEAGRAGIENIGLGSERGAWRWRTYRVTRRSRENVHRPEARPLPRTGRSPLPGMGGVRRKSFPEASYCALRAISISRILSSASFTLRSR